MANQLSEDTSNLEWSSGQPESNVSLQTEQLDERSEYDTSKETNINDIFPVLLPSLRLHSPKGRELDIDSHLQRNIRLNKLCHVLGLSEFVSDWKLPKVQVPSRPDFSRNHLTMYRPPVKPVPAISDTSDNSVSSKYQIENLQKLNEFLDYQSDTVPSYVAAYLESSPRDPLAAEESSRKASNRFNEAAPKKIYLPFVSQASLHVKLTGSTEVKENERCFPGWCYGCRIQHGIELYHTHPSYDPSRDRPVRVGGGFAYMNRDMEPHYMAAMKKLKEEQEETVRLVKEKVKSVSDLPDMYKPGYHHFKPKIMKRDPLLSSNLPVISETDQEQTDHVYRVPKGYETRKSNKPNTKADYPFNKGRQFHISTDGQYKSPSQFADVNGLRHNLKAPDNNKNFDGTEVHQSAEYPYQMEDSKLSYIKPEVLMRELNKKTDSIDLLRNIDQSVNTLISRDDSNKNPHINESESYEDSSQFSAISHSTSNQDSSVHDELGITDGSSSKQTLNSSSVTKTNISDQINGNDDDPHMELTRALQQAVHVTSYAKDELSDPCVHSVPTSQAITPAAQAITPTDIVMTWSIPSQTPPETPSSIEDYDGLPVMKTTISTSIISATNSSASPTENIPSSELYESSSDYLSPYSYSYTMIDNSIRLTIEYDTPEYSLKSGLCYIINDHLAIKSPPPVLPLSSPDTPVDCHYTPLDDGIQEELVSVPSEHTHTPDDKEMSAMPPQEFSKSVQDEPTLLDESPATPEPKTEEILDEQQLSNESSPTISSPAVRYSPLFDDKPELRWIVKPLTVEDTPDIFCSPQLFSPPAEHTRDNEEIYSDPNLLEMENNTYAITTVSSKEFVPVWTITREIINDIVGDVMRIIVKKKPPPKKTKSEVIKRKITNKQVEPKPIIPPLETQEPPPAAEPTPSLPRQPTPPPKDSTPPPPKELTPILPPPKEPTPPPPKVITPKKPVELPPLPPLPALNKVQKAPPQRVLGVSNPSVTKTMSSGASIPKQLTPANTNKLLQSSDTHGYLSPSPISAPGSPELDFVILTRSPTPDSGTKELPQLPTLHVRTLNRKVGNDWTFRKELQLPDIKADSLVEAPKEQDPPKQEESPEVVDKPKTPEPEPEPAPRRIRNLPTGLSKLKRAVRKHQKVSSIMTTKKELKAVEDPMDYLAKYCLIHPDRLPLYERVFKDILSRQMARFPEMYCTVVLDPDTGKSRIQPLGNLQYNSVEITPRQRELLREMAKLSRVPNADQPAMNIGEVQVAKLTFTIEQLYDKYDHMLHEVDELEILKAKRIGWQAREMFPHVLHPDYNPNRRRKKKKILDPNEEKRRIKEFVISDEQVMARLTKTEKDKLFEEEEIHKMILRLSRLKTKIKNAEKRMDQLEAERMEMLLWAQELYLEDSLAANQPTEFRRKQSALFNKLHPASDEQMNIEEVEEALRTINGQLLTEKEMQFIYHILKIPGRKCVNIKTFSCVAALSEKVTQLHPDIRKLINKFSFEALDVKMEKCKELFALLVEGQTDTVSMRTLCVELLAGGLNDENLKFVTSKFNRKQRGFLEYMDFLTYVPLFVELHDRICTNPLTTERVN